MQFENETIQIVVNVLIQAVNLLIIFFIFKYFFAWKIIQSMEERKQLLEKIKNAKEEYDKKIKEAKEESEKIIDEAKEHKNKILQEAEDLAKQEKQKIISNAERKAEDIIENAKMKSDSIQKELEDSWEESVKETVRVVVWKLIEEDVQLQDKYISNILEQAKK